VPARRKPKYTTLRMFTGCIADAANQQITLSAVPDRDFYRHENLVRDCFAHSRMGVEPIQGWPHFLMGRGLQFGTPLTVEQAEYHERELRHAEDLAARDVLLHHRVHALEGGGRLGIEELTLRGRGRGRGDLGTQEAVRRCASRLLHVYCDTVS
jgi:hypothetical protein